MTNIIHITGNDSYGVELELKRWISAFEKKYGNINIDRYDLSEALANLKDILLSGWLFAEKRLFIFRGGRDRKSKSGGFEELLGQIHKQLPTDHFLLFHNISEKEVGLQDWLWQYADTREINTLWQQSIWEQRYNVSPQTIRQVLAQYREQESQREKWDTNALVWHEVSHTLRMIELMEESGVSPTPETLQRLIHGYGGDTLFALVDAILSGDTMRMLTTLDRIKSTTRVDEWFPILIWLLRNHVYIHSLKSLWLPEREIAKNIAVHPYVLKMSLQAKVSSIQLRDFYRKIIETSIAYKRGKWLKDSELWRILSIELALLSLKK